MKKKEVDGSKLKISPFLGSLKIAVTRIVEPSKFMDKDGIMQPVEYYIEREDYVKIYYADGSKRLIMSLSPSAKVLYLFILYHLEMGKDWFVLDRQLFMQQTKTGSINTLKKSIIELWDKNIIIPTSQTDVYWIDPKLFFCGNRVTKYPNNIDIKSTFKK